MSEPVEHPAPHPDDVNGSLSSRLNWLRAGVLGANDGIVSTAGLVVGVAGADVEQSTLLLTGVAGLVAGALSMAAGEYVSVSAQRDTERAALAKEKRELRDMPEAELEELTQAYVDRGLDSDLARQVALQLTAKDSLGAHAEVELKIDPNETSNPWHAAGASMTSFALGALLPLLAIVLPPVNWRVGVTLATVTVALVLTGVVSARLGGAGATRAAWRNVVGGLLAMTVAWLVGRAVGGVI